MQLDHVRPGRMTGARWQFQDIETLILSSTGTIIGTGNILANTITMTGTGSGTLVGSDGNDTLTGAGNNDILNGANHDDTIAGNAGHDLLFGEAGNDKLTGGAGNDTLNGGLGNDSMTGGTGTDYYFVNSTKDTVTEGADPNFNFDTVESELASYTLGANVEGLKLGNNAVSGTGNTLNNFLEGNGADNTLDGAGGHDGLEGGFGNDLLLGQAGEDHLRGGDGADTLKGGIGNDHLWGEFGDDVIFGEAGADRIMIGTTDPNELLLHGNDKINGFQSGTDVIEVGELLSGFGVGTLEDAFNGDYLLLTKNGADTLVQLDKDGSGGVAAVTVATVVSAAIAETDFYYGSV